MARDNILVEKKKLTRDKNEKLTGGNHGTINRTINKTVWK